MATYLVPAGTMPQGKMRSIDPNSYYSSEFHDKSRKRYRMWVCSNSRRIAAEITGTYRAMGRHWPVM